MPRESYESERRREWGAVARGWERWWETLERGAGRVSERIVELAGLGPGGRAVDLATGIGEPAATAARRVGPAGRIVAVDLSPEMLAIARRRAAALGLANIDFLEADVESVDLPEGAFDAVISRWGLMFLADLEGFLARSRRLLVPGGRFVAAVWGRPEKVPMIAVAMDVIRGELGLPPSAPGDEGPFRLSEASVVARALSRSGYGEVVVERMAATFAWPSAEGYADFTEEVGGTTAALLARVPRGRRDAVRRAIEEGARAFGTADGVRMENEIVVFAGRG